jgi:hypothetical protein
MKSSVLSRHSGGKSKVVWPTDTGEACLTRSVRIKKAILNFSIPTRRVDSKTQAGQTLSVAWLFQTGSDKTHLSYLGLNPRTFGVGGNFTGDGLNPDNRRLAARPLT